MFDFRVVNLLCSKPHEANVSVMDSEPCGSRALIRLELIYDLVGRCMSCKSCFILATFGLASGKDLIHAMIRMIDANPQYQ